MPRKAAEDALHIAIAAAHGIQFLLTWSVRHIANATLRRAIERVCRDSGFALRRSWKMTTRDDEIVAEIRHHREAHAASLDYDIKRITKDFQEQERTLTRRVVTRQRRKPLSAPSQASV